MLHSALAALFAAVYLSPEHIVAATDGAVVVSAATAGRVVRVTAEGRVAADVTLRRSQSGDEAPFNPTGLALDANGAVYVTAGVDDGELQKFAPDGRRLASVATGHWPCAPLVSRDGRRVYLARRFTAEVEERDALSLALLRTFRVLREPVALAQAGGRLFVANLLPDVAATNETVAAAVSVIDLSSGRIASVRLPNGSTGVRGICATPDGRYVFATHSQGRFQLPTTQLERGWMNTSACSVLEGATGRRLNTFLLDDVDRGAANPWGAAVSPDGRHLAIAHAGTAEVSVIEIAPLLARLAGRDASYDLALLKGIRRRVALPGEGPRGVTWCGTRLVAALYFADALASVDVAAGGAAKALPLAPCVDLTNDRVRRGEMLFHSADLCFQQWQSCSSCHPDGRADGLNWDLLNDGIGNAKQTKSLLYAHLTPPTMVTGVRPNLAACNRAGLTHIQFVQRPEEDALCLDAYVASLRPVPSPFLVGGQRSASAERGRAVYEKADCARCHGGPLTTDMQMHDVGLAAAPNASPSGKFDTPTLAECWRTAPYLYDGRACTLRHVLVEDNPRDTHGRTKALSKSELADLLDYLLTL